VRPSTSCSRQSATSQQPRLPDKIAIDKSGANTAAIQRIQADAASDIELQRIKYLNDIVEQEIGQ